MEQDTGLSMSDQIYNVLFALRLEVAPSIVNDLQTRILNVVAKVEQQVRLANEREETLKAAILTLQDQLQDAVDALQPFAQFANIEARQHEAVTISVKIDALRNARNVLGGAFRDEQNLDIPL